jgi:hypothetical protein
MEHASVISAIVRTFSDPIGQLTHSQPPSALPSSEPSQTPSVDWFIASIGSAFVGVFTDAVDFLRAFRNVIIFPGSIIEVRSALSG